MENVNFNDSNLVCTLQNIFSAQYIRINVQFFK